MSAAPQGPQCQSCGMPMAKPEDFGTNADGSRNEQYCTYCFQAGEFTAPDMTMEQMIEHVAAIGADKLGMAEDAAKQMAEQVIPKLKRWQSA